ncbi:hypothetical protein [Promicromonospora sukumoe]|uniref:hypothetical protein n=1 Tax=Promicromonospora sukumoe TaxID=88382 RepID=UPI003669982A
MSHEGNRTDHDLANSATDRSRRARRGRTARLAGLGGGAVVAAGALVLGATQLATPGLASALPTYEPVAANVAQQDDDALRDVPQPHLLAGTALRCGANVADLSFSDDVVLAATGDLTTDSVYYEEEWSSYDSLPLRVADAAGDDASENDLNAPTFVWVAQDGTVVHLGGWEEYPMYLAHEDGVPTAQEDRTSSCAPDGAGQWLADGEYTVYPMTVEYSTDTLVAGEPLPATVVDGEPQWAKGGQEAPVPFELPGDPDQTLLPDRGFGSVVVDRTGTWERHDTYRAVWPEQDLTEGEGYVVQARCTSSDPDDSITYELSGKWGDVTGEIACDGHDRTDGTWGYQAPDVPGEPVGIELTDVPDGVALAYARLVPASVAS